MNTNEATAALARGGLIIPESESAETDLVDGAMLPRYQPSKDPLGAEELACALAFALHGNTVDTVLVWDDGDDLVLAHIVARELGAIVLRAFEVEGLVLPMGDGGPAGAVVLLADAFRTRAAIRALRASAERDGGRVVAVAALVATRQLDAAIGLPVHTALPALQLGGRL